MKNRNDTLGLLAGFIVAAAVVLLGITLHAPVGLVALLGTTLSAVAIKFFGGPSEVGQPWYK